MIEMLKIALWFKFDVFDSSFSYLTLMGVGGDNLIYLPFLNQILSAKFLSKTFWWWKLTLIQLIWHPAELLESYK